MKPDELRKYIETRGVEYLEIAYISARLATEIVKISIERDIAIIGIEGFIQTRDGVIPQIDLIADFSFAGEIINWEDYKQMCIKGAERYIEEGLSNKENIVLNFTILTRQDWLSKMGDSLEDS